MRKLFYSLSFIFIIFIIFTNTQDVEASTYTLDVNITHTEGSVYVYNNTTSSEIETFPANVNSGDSITIQAWSKVGYEFYRFHYVFVDGPPDWFISSNPNTWAMNYDTTINIQFNEVDTYILDVNLNSLEGSVTVQNITTGAYITTFPREVNENHEVTFTATPETGYDFKNYKIDFGSTTLYTSENPFTYTMDKDTTFTVQFDEIVTKTVGLNLNSLEGSVTVYNETEEEWITSFPSIINYGDEITFTATPAVGYEFDKYAMTPVGGSTINITSNPFTWTVIHDSSFVVLFSQIPTTFISIQEHSSSHGSVTVYNETTMEMITPFPYDTVEVNTGDEITLTSTPAVGYEFDKYGMTPEGGSTINITSNPFTFTAQTDSQFKPHFSEIPTTTFDIIIDPLEGFVIVWNYTEGEWITSFPTTVNRSDEIGITTVAYSGYQFDKYAMTPVGGSTINITSNPFTWTSLTDTTFIIHLIETHQITHNYSPFGETSVFNPITNEEYSSFPITVTDGSILRFTATPNPFYVFSHWNINPSSASDYITIDNPYYITINGDIDITPHYAVGFQFTADYDDIISNITITNIATSEDYALIFPIGIPTGTELGISLELDVDTHVFSHWIIQVEGEPSINNLSPNLTYEMPSDNVVFTAHYSQIYDPPTVPPGPDSPLLTSLHSILGVIGMNTTAGYIIISMIILIGVNLAMVFTSISGIGYIIVNTVIVGFLTYVAFIPAWIVILFAMLIMFGFISLKGVMKV